MPPELSAGEAPDSVPPSCPRPRRHRALLWAGGPWLSALLLSALLLPGCPFFPESGCFVDGDCAQGTACEARTGLCVAAPRPARVCVAPEECAFNETCSRQGVCRAGDCTFSGCVTGYACDRADGAWACVALSSEGQGGSAGEGSADDAASE